jgi:ABC-2 type transport system permease protein
MRRTLPVARGVAWRSVKNALTNPSLLLPATLFPLFFFVAFAGGLSQVSEVPGFDYPGDYTAFQFGFVLLQSAAFGGVFTGFSIARDFESGFGRRLLLAAPDRQGIVLGYAIAALVRWATVAVALTVVAFAIGMEIASTPEQVVGVFTLAALLNAAGLLWSAGIAFRFRTIQAGPLMQMPVFMILFFAPVYVPLALLAGWIHAVATLNPVTYMLEAVRSLLAGQPEEVLLAYAFGLALVGALGGWALRGLRRAERAG